MQAYTQFESGAYTRLHHLGAALHHALIRPARTRPTPSIWTAESYYPVDPTSAAIRRAPPPLAAHDELIQKYPTRPGAEDASKKILSVKDQLGGKEMDIGRFFTPAQASVSGGDQPLQDAGCRRHQTTRHAEEALARLVEATTPWAWSTRQILWRRYRAQFPGQPVAAADSYDLQEGRLAEPSEDTSSWISRLLAGVKP